MVRRDVRRKLPLVLIADDDEMMRSLMTAALSEKGFTTVEVGDGIAALDAFVRHRPDLVVLDVDMPLQDGFATCRAIRDTPLGRNVPIVIVTGNEGSESIDKAYDTGATDFISKPVNWSLLGHRIKYVLRGAQLRGHLERSEAANRALLEALPDQIAVVDSDGVIRDVVRSDGDATHPHESGLAGQSIAALFPKDVQSRAMRSIQTVNNTGVDQSFEFSDSGPAGPRYYEARLVRHVEGSVLIVLRDTTQRKRAEDQIHRLAYFDTLTGLHNRHHFMNRLAAMMDSADAAKSELALLYVNLDQFKRINNTLGHESGDRILAAVAARLRELQQSMHAAGCNVELARMGGDEFAVLFANDGAAAVDERVGRVVAVVSELLTSEAYEFVITPSIGIALYPQDGHDVVTLLKNAVRAMYVAKRLGRNTHVHYSGAMAERGVDRLELESSLRKALEQHELMLYFQPKYDLATNQMTGAEALLRWLHKDHGMISPAAFIPIAEETGLIVDIDRWVVNRACEYLALWSAAGLPTVPIAVNMSGREFCYENPAQTIGHALTRHGVEAGLLEIEVTESVLMGNAQDAVEKLEELHRMGVRLAVDDFGTGYSSLSYLKQFSLDVLKIDRSFIADLDVDGSDRALCRAMISMAQGLGLKVVAEGIETEEQQAFLTREGCDMGQGFLLDRPMDADSFAAKLIGQVPLHRGDAPSVGRHPTH